MLLQTENSNDAAKSSRQITDRTSTDGQEDEEDESTPDGEPREETNISAICKIIDQRTGLFEGIESPTYDAMNDYYNGVG